MKKFRRVYGLASSPNYNVAIQSGGDGGGAGYETKILDTYTSDLYAYWPMDETSGTTMVNALGVSGRDGVYSSAGVGLGTFKDGTVCPTFDGIVGYGYAKTNANWNNWFNASEGGLVGWVKSTDFSSPLEGAIRVLNNFNYYIYVLNDAVNIMELKMYAGQTAQQNVSPSTDTWHMYSFTWSQSQNEFASWFNSTKGTPSAYGDIDGSMTLINTGRYASFYAPCQIGHMMFFNRHLTQTDIDDLVVMP